MNNTINVDGIGKIGVTENFWTGKRDLFLINIKLDKVSKKQFFFYIGEERKDIFVEGNFLFGLSCTIDNVKYQLIESTKWYEYVLSVFRIIFIITWGNIPATVKIFPVVGGAIGGFIVHY